MTVLHATGHLVGRTFVVGEPATCVLYQGCVFPCPPWGLDTERLDCMLGLVRRGIGTCTSTCSIKVPCPEHMRFASPEEEKAARPTKAQLEEKRRASPSGALRIAALRRAAAVVEAQKRWQAEW